MNPITLGIHGFHEQLRLLLDPPVPGRAAIPIARLALDGVDDKLLLQALRLYENADRNLHSFSVHTAPITDEATYLAAARDQLRADLASVRVCFERAGLAVPAQEVPPFASADAFARAFAGVASASTQLDGLVVVLAPSRVNDAAVLVRIIEALACVVKHPRLVVLVKDDGSDALRRIAPHAITFRVDQAAFWKWARDPVRPNKAGPPRDNAPKLTPEARAQLEASIGKRIPTEENGKVLRHLIMDAGKALAERRLDVAAKQFRMARTYCQMLGLHAERAACAIGVGTSRFGLGQRDLALRAYGEAREIAVQHGIPSVHVQAELGIGATQLALGAYARAREAYERCARAVPDNPSVQIECFRMRGQTFALEKRPGDAVATWLEALAAVEALPALARGTTSYGAIVEQLAEALPRAARAHEVTAVKQRGETIRRTVEQAHAEAREAALRE